jgi:hypothetical protein
MTMVIRQTRFNLYFSFALLLTCGCQSPESKQKHQLSTLRVHVETSRDLPDRNTVINVPRNHPIALRIEKAPFLTEAQIAKAEIIDVTGGFAMRLQFDRQGLWLLEQFSAGNRGKHFAIFSQFVPVLSENMNEGRWLAAPKITAHITDGTLVFTPDATREEADQIVLGLSNIARQLEKNSKSWNW